LKPVESENVAVIFDEGNRLCKEVITVFNEEKPN
jgi:hypothetical protein